VIWKGKAIPSVASLVEAMFMAEMKNLLLTAGHDLDVLKPCLTLDVTRGVESYETLRGEMKTVKAGDMIISDRLGIVSNIIYGPDRRTQITAETRNVVFTAYAPAGIDQQTITAHLKDIRESVKLTAPRSQTEMLEVFGGG
jgi:DNA/RNA-binding domain of Phe-tRNA-synthetase-like protein